MADTVETRLRSLAAMARALGRSERIDAILELSAEECLTAMGAASVSISRMEPGTGFVRTLINVGELAPWESRWPQDEVYSMQDFTALREVVEHRRSWAWSVDGPDVDSEEAALLVRLGKHSSLGAPLIVDGAFWGELYVTRRVDQGSFHDSESAYVEALAAIMSGAISRALHVMSLEEMAFRDPLTGLANRRAVDDAVAQSLDGFASGTVRDLAVVLADANGLKTLNDERGHAEGDQFLRQIGGCLVDSFAVLPGCLVARIGGDEFGVVVVGHPVDAVLDAATEMVQATHQLSLGAGVSCGVAAVTAVAGGPDRRGPRPIGVVAGSGSSGASVTVRTPTPSELFQAADRAQYEAKRRRIRRAVLARPPLGAAG